MAHPASERGSQNCEKAVSPTPTRARPAASVARQSLGPPAPRGATDAGAEARVDPTRAQKASQSPLAPTACGGDFQPRRPRVRPGSGPAPGGGIHHCVWREAGGAFPGAPRRPALSAGQGGRGGRRAAGGRSPGRGDGDRGAAAAAVSQAGAGAASPALIGPSPAAWAGNCCLGLGGTLRGGERAPLLEREPGSAQVGGRRAVRAVPPGAWRPTRRDHPRGGAGSRGKPRGGGTRRSV